MATRITFDNLASQAERLNKATDGRYGFSIEGAYGKWRLAGRNGSRDVSGYMTARELSTWIIAFDDGLAHATKLGYYAGIAMYHVA